MMVDTLDTLESRRLEWQLALDAAKSSAERNRLGQYATPSDLATLLLEKANQIIPSTKSVRFLDPALGTGAFVSALFRVFGRERVVAVTGYEIDPHYGEPAQQLWEGYGLKVLIDDFTMMLPPATEAERYDLIVCNPPYVRHHHLQPTHKQQLQSRAASACNVKVSGLSGLYIYFMCIAHQWLRHGGIAGWLVPAEFMDVNYGQAIRNYLTQHVTLLEIHHFDAEDVQFDDALVSSAIVWFRNERPAVSHRVTFTTGRYVDQPRQKKMLPIDELRREPKWTRLTRYGIRSAPDSAERLRDLFTIKRGVATGANQFFILDAAHELFDHLPASFYTPILPSPRYLTDDEILADTDGRPLIPKQLYLLTCDVPEIIVEQQHPDLWKYLEVGKAQGIHERYLCRTRARWYRQDKRAPAPFLCTYMGRQTNGVKESPFRFILNHSEAIAPNVYLNMYPKTKLQRHLYQNPALKEIIWRALQAIPADQLIGEGRVYGGGLFKLEPKELGNLLIQDVFKDVEPLLESIPYQQRLF